VRRPRRGLTAVALVVGLVMGGVALVPTAGADQLADKQAEASRVADQLQAIQSRQMDISAQAERVGWEQSQAEAAVSEAEQRLADTNAELDDRRAEVRDVAVEAYLKGNDSEELDAVLTSEATEGLQKRTYLESRTSDMKDKVDGLAAARQQAEDDQARLEEAEKALEAKAAEIAQLKKASDKALADQQALNAKVQGELQTLVAAEQQRRAEEAQRAAAAQQAAAAQRQAAQPQAAQPQAATTTRSTGGTSSTTAPSRPVGAGTSTPTVPSNPAPPPVGSGAGGAISAALTRVGIGSYVWGASGPVNFDCSGLVLWAYRQVGVSLPHYSGAQYASTTRISASQLQPGDLVFWGSSGSEHVAIYMGGNQLVHAFGSGGGVRVTPLSGWWKPPTGYGRINY